MTRVSVELLTDEGNDAVVRLPAREYPGVLVQGDSLHSLAGLTAEMVEALDKAEFAEATSLARMVAERLNEMTERYESALRKHSVPFPY